MNTLGMIDLIRAYQRKRDYINDLEVKLAQEKFHLMSEEESIKQQIGKRVLDTIYILGLKETTEAKLEKAQIQFIWQLIFRLYHKIPGVGKTTEIEILKALKENGIVMHL